MQKEILAILDRCADAYTFPMLDNGYFYLDGDLMLARTASGALMRRSSWIAALAAIPFATFRMLAQRPVSASGDTVVLIVKSPRGQEVTFSGTILLRDAKTTRRLDNVKTPFELRLPAQDLDARFVADDGAGLDGKIVAFRGGEKRGQVWGTVYRGPLQLYFEPGKGFGFGDRNAAPARVVP